MYLRFRIIADGETSRKVFSSVTSERRNNSKESSKRNQNQMMEEVPPLNFPEKSLEEVRASIPEHLLPAPAQQRLWDARAEA